MSHAIYICRICNNSDKNSPIIAREMMFGFRDQFSYFECSSCGCLQITDIPSNMSKYYPDKYAAHLPRDSIKNSLFYNFLKRKRGDHLLGKGSLIGYLVTRFLGAGLSWIRYPTISRNDRVLDVGCGGGNILASMKAMGFSNLTGIDPFIPATTEIHGIPVQKADLDQVEGQYDLVTFHHSFEHVSNPLPTLMKASQLTRPGKLIVVRIPLMGKHAWKRYGTNWVQLDAPRHFHLHTEKSMNIAANNAGLLVEKIVYESTAFQFVGSELYLNDIPLFSERPSKERSMEFSKSQILMFEKAAQQLNTERDGDEACFYLRKTK